MRRDEAGTLHLTGLPNGHGLIVGNYFIDDSNGRLGPLFCIHPLDGLCPAEVPEIDWMQFDNFLRQQRPD